MSEKNGSSNDYFTFESYGVPLRVESSDPDLLKDASIKAREGLAGSFRMVEGISTQHVFRLEREDRKYVIIKDGETFRHGDSRIAFLRYFDSAVRLVVAEFAVGLVFVHAGVVGWKGKAIVIPGVSYSGKTSLVAEFVKKGAEYYSDEYAVFDEKGFVHPFARKLALRSRPPHGEVIEMTYLTAEELGGRNGFDALPVGWVLCTRFEEDGKWEPEILSPGQGIMEMLSQTIPIRYAPEFSLEVLKKVTANAIIIKSIRSHAVDFVNLFLDLVDNKAF